METNMKPGTMTLLRRMAVPVACCALAVATGEGQAHRDRRDNLAVRRSNCVLMDTNFDTVHNIEQCFGDGAEGEQYLVGDWNGDRRDNLAVRHSSCVLMDTSFDAVHDIEQCYGFGAGEAQYLVGDWDGDGRDNLAVRRSNCVLMDTNFDAAQDIRQCYGNGVAEDEYLSGNWNCYQCPSTSAEAATMAAARWVLTEGRRRWAGRRAFRLRRRCCGAWACSRSAR
jgi:hypothetical protein